MPFNRKQTDYVEHDWVHELANIVTDQNGLETLRGILAVIAQAQVDAWTTKRCWISMGQKRSGDGMLLTIHIDDDKLYADGDTLADLAASCEALLATPTMPPSRRKGGKS